MSSLPQYPNQGQQIVLGWDNEINLKNWTAYVGSDGERFLPPNDRNGFTDGADRRLPLGRVLMAGMPIARLTFPWLSYGQLDYLETTFDGQNVTVAVHKPTSLTAWTTLHYNAVCNLNLNQARTLTRKSNGYEAWEVEFVLVEPL